ncbi:MAG: hypothetical protein ACK4ZM_04940 [bacterium]
MDIVKIDKGRPFMPFPIDQKPEKDKDKQTEKKEDSFSENAKDYYKQNFNSETNKTD